MRTRCGGHTALPDANCAWYAAHRARLWAAGLLPVLVHAAPEDIATNCLITELRLREALGGGATADRWRVVARATAAVDLALPLSSLWFLDGDGSEEDDDEAPDHAAIVCKGVVMQSFWRQYRPRQTPLTAALRRAVREADVAEFAGLPALVGQRRPWRVWQLAPLETLT